MIKTGISLTDHEKILSMLFGCNGAATAADEVELENKMVIFLREVRGWHSPFLRLTDDRKRCFKRKRDLILRWRCNTKLVLTATTLSGPERKDGALGGYKVKTTLKH